MNARDWRATARTYLHGLPLGTRTNWLVLTGPPGSGKTAVKDALAAQGVQVNRDVSHDYIQELVSTGLTALEVRADPLALQQEILWRMIIDTAELDPATPTVLEYALPDNVAFWQEEGLELSADVFHSALLFRYARVVLCDPLPPVPDGVRVETAESQASIISRMREVYTALGYDVLVLTRESVPERAAKVTRHWGVL